MNSTNSQTLINQLIAARDTAYALATQYSDVGDKTRQQAAYATADVISAIDTSSLTPSNVAPDWMQSMLDESAA